MEVQVDRHEKLAGMVTSIEAFCQRLRSGLAEATCAQKRTLVELLIDRVLVDNGAVEIRYVIPTTPRGETTRFYQLRKDYFHMPLIPRPRTPASQLIGVRLPAFPTPLADRFLGDDDATDEQEFFHITMAQRETAIQPDRVADDFPREPMMFVEIGGGSGRHSSSI